MVYRRFFQMLDSRGKSEVGDWRNQLSEKGKARFDVLISSLIRTRMPNRGFFKKLKGACRPLWEIRFDFSNVEYGILCHERSLRFAIPDYVMLMVAEERNGRFVPATACATAKARMRWVEEDFPRRTRAHD